MTDEGLVAVIQELLRDSPFHGEGYRKLWDRLRFAGIVFHLARLREEWHRASD
jgi:putative transposase